MLKNSTKILIAILVSVFSNFSWPVLANEFVELPRDLEIELALSALPAGLQGNATIYVRDPEKGFVRYRKGSNDFTTFVARTSIRFYGADWNYSYPNDQLIPIAYDSIGAKHHLVPYFDIERMRINGVLPETAKQILKQRFKDKTYLAPVKGGLSYMLAPILRAYMAPAKSNEIKTVSFPHHMTYAPYVNGERLGVMDPQNRAGVLDHGGHDTGPHGYLYFMVQPDQADAIRIKYTKMLDRLCQLHTKWCLPGMVKQ